MNSLFCFFDSFNFAYIFMINHKLLGLLLLLGISVCPALAMHSLFLNNNFHQLKSLAPQDKNHFLENRSFFFTDLSVDIIDLRFVIYLLCLALLGFKQNPSALQSCSV